MALGFRQVADVPRYSLYQGISTGRTGAGPCLIEGEAAKRWLSESTSKEVARSLLLPYQGELTVRDLDRAINRSSAPNEPALLRAI